MKQEDYVSYEVAKMLKEEGYDKKCSSLYLSNATFIEDMYECKDFEKKIEDGFCDAPSLSEAAKWLREEKQIWVYVFPEYHQTIEYRVRVVTFDNLVDNSKSKGKLLPLWFEKYEQALNEGILEALKIIRKEN